MHKQQRQSTGPNLGALNQALDSISTQGPCCQAALEGAQAALGPRLWRCCDGDYCSSWRELIPEGMPRQEPPRRAGLQPPQHGRRAAVPPGYTPTGALEVVPKLLAVLEWMLKGCKSRMPAAAAAQGMLHGLQQALHGVVTAAFDPAVAPRSGQRAFFQMLQQHGYLATTTRCVAALSTPSSTTPDSSELHLLANTTLATMEALQMLMDALRWTEDPKLLAVAPPDRVCETVYAALAAPGLLPRLATLTMTVVEAAEAAGAQPGEDPAATAAVLMGSRFSWMLMLLGDRLARIDSYSPCNPGPLPAVVGNLVCSPAWMALAGRTMSTALNWQRCIAESTDGMRLMVPPWHQEAPWLDPRPVGCFWNTVHLQLHGLRMVLHAAVQHSCCSDVDTVDAPFMKLLLEACELCRVWDVPSTHGSADRDVELWNVLKEAFFAAPHEELTTFVEEAASPLVDIICAVVEQSWQPDAAAEHFKFLGVMAGCMMTISKPQDMRMVLGRLHNKERPDNMGHSLAFDGLYRRAAALVSAGDGRLMATFESIVRGRNAFATNHVPLIFFPLMPDAMPKMLHSYTQPRLAQRTYGAVTTVAKWLLAVVGMLSAAAAPSAAVARSMSVKKHNPDTDVGSLEDVVRWDWRMTFYSALSIADQLAQLAQVSFSRALYWLDERLVPISPSTSPQLLPAMQRRRATTIELLAFGAENLGRRSPHDIYGVRLHADGSMAFAVDNLGPPLGPAADMGRVAEQLGQALEGHLQQEEQKRQERKERKRSGRAAGVTDAGSSRADVSRRDQDAPGKQQQGRGSDQVFVLHSGGGGGGASDRAASAASAVIARSFEVLATGDDAPAGPLLHSAPSSTRPSHSESSGKGSVADGSLASSSTGGDYGGRRPGSVSASSDAHSTAGRAEGTGAPDLSAMALLVGCRAGGAAAAALPALAALEALMSWQPRPVLADGRVQVAVPGMTVVSELQEAKRMVIKIRTQLQAVAELALKLSSLLCAHLPPSQAAILSSAAKSSIRGGGADDAWPSVVTALQHVMPPKPPGCWHPACVNLEGMREAELSTLKCARCRARYCSKSCQKAHWKLHKEVCGVTKASTVGARAGTQ